MGSLHYIKRAFTQTAIDVSALSKTDSILSLLGKFQERSNFSDLIEAYFEGIQSLLGIEGVRYEYPLLNIDLSLGNASCRACNYQLTADNQFWGDIAIYRRSELSTAEFSQFELVTALLITPLRSLIGNESNKLISSEGNPVAIPNPEMADQLVTREAKLAFRDNKPLSLILFDVDRFDQIIETSGLVHSEKVLYEVMNIAYNCIRSSDLLMRYDKDFFSLALWGVKGQDALGVSERIRQAVDENVFTDSEGKVLHVTISSGIAELESTDSLDLIFGRAHKALKLARSKGNNNCQLANHVFVS